MVNSTERQNCQRAPGESIAEQRANLSTTIGAVARFGVKLGRFQIFWPSTAGLARRSSTLEFFADSGFNAAALRAEAMPDAGLE